LDLIRLGGSAALQTLVDTDPTVSDTSSHPQLPAEGVQAAQPVAEAASQAQLPAAQTVAAEVAVADAPSDATKTTQEWPDLEDNNIEFSDSVDAPAGKITEQDVQRYIESRIFPPNVHIVGTGRPTSHEVVGCWQPWAVS